VSGQVGVPRAQIAGIFLDDRGAALILDGLRDGTIDEIAEELQELANAQTAQFQLDPNRSFGSGSQLEGFGLFLPVDDSRETAVTAAVTGLGELAMTNRIPYGTLALALIELARRFKRLNASERSVFQLMRRLAQGGSIYRVWIAEDDLLSAMDQDLSDDSRRRLLANMKSQRLLEEGARKWRAVW
jgi:hypothetical protein